MPRPTPALSTSHPTQALPGEGPCGPLLPMPRRLAPEPWCPAGGAHSRLLRPRPILGSSESPRGCSGEAGLPTGIQTLQLRGGPKAPGPPQGERTALSASKALVRLLSSHGRWSVPTQCSSAPRRPPACPPDAMRSPGAMRPPGAAVPAACSLCRSGRKALDPAPVAQGDRRANHEPDGPVHICAPPPTSCVTPGKLLNFSRPPSPQLRHESDNNIYLLGRLSE